jgi:hypothetical protein
MPRYSLRELLVVFIGVSASFVAGFLPIRNQGGVAQFVAGMAAITAICFVAVFSMKRFAVTAGLLFTVAATLGAMISMPPDDRNLGIVLFFLAVFGFPPAFITVPLTISRRMGTTNF